MSGIASTRRQGEILTWLESEGSLSIGQIVERFGVSAMTVHRDLDQLAEQRLVRKVRGGVLSVVSEPVSWPERAALCDVCGKRVPARTGWVMTTQTGERRHACCSHCGLLQLQHSAGLQSALAADFLLSRMVNAYQATYLVGSDVNVCCVPVVLCFSTRVDATKFRAGFGGDVMDFGEALAALGEMHHGAEPRMSGKVHD